MIELTALQRIEHLLERRPTNANERAARATPGTVLHRVAVRMINEREDDLLAFRLTCLTHNPTERTNP